MASGTDAWPDSLRAFVSATFAACTEVNKAKVESELKAAIYKAYSAGKLNDVDWANYQLESLKKPQKRKKENALFAQTGLLTPQENALRQKRARRFEDDASSKAGSGLVARMGSSSLSTPEPEALHNPDVIDWDRHTIVGTSIKLEKPYLRLTSLPDPATIRPLPVLKQTLDLLKTKWRTEGNYAYICDQFKSMRQDLTNDFTVSVYEIHARIALEKGDLGEYNQCQSMLRQLYQHGLKGHPLEFAAYRILYLLHTRNRSEINGMLSALTDAERSDPGIRHALEVRSAMATSNYHRLFKRFLDAPKMGAYMIDHFLDRERVAALTTMTKAYMTLPLAFVVSELALDNTDQLHDILTKHDAAVYTEPSLAAYRAAGRSSAMAETRILDCRKAHPFLLASLSRFAKIDIKASLRPLSLAQKAMKQRAGPDLTPPAVDSHPRTVL